MLSFGDAKLLLGQLKSRDLFSRFYFWKKVLFMMAKEFRGL